MDDIEHDELLRAIDDYIFEKEKRDKEQAMNDVITTTKNELEPITENQLIEYLDAAGMTSKLDDKEKKMFLNIAKEFRLNPFKREIHVSVYGEGQYRNLSIITGYEVYIKRAERTGKLDGWKCWTEGSGNELKAKIQIYRKDQKYPFEHEVYYSEAVQYNKEGKPNKIWGKMPRFMLKKVCIGQGFRLCFSDDLGGMPYEESELPQAEPINVTPNGTLQPQNETEEREEILNETAEILKAKDKNGLGFFTASEITAEREIAKSADNETLTEQYKRLEKELLVRQASDEAIVF